MKKVLLVTASLIALGAAAPAVAADLAARPYTKAPPMIAAVYDWSGFYIGVNGGWGSSRKCWDAVVPNVLVGPEGSHDASGGTVGGQIGYRWQAGTWVFGLEAQGNWADFKGSNASLLFPGFVNHSKIDAFGLFTGQVGYAVNNVLLYVKGGAAVTSNRNHINTVAGALACVHRRRHPLGWHGRCWPRIRLRPELVDWRRIQSHLPAGQDLHLHHSGWRLLRHRWRYAQDMNLRNCAQRAVFRAEVGISPQRGRARGEQKQERRSHPRGYLCALGASAVKPPRRPIRSVPPRMASDASFSISAASAPLR